MTLADGVSYCGFNSPKSFGGNSYFLEHPDGNWLIDAPRYVEHLVRRFAERGGLRYIFLTHRDDVADADKYAKRFGAERIIHRLELSAQPDAERVIDGIVRRSNWRRASSRSPPPVTHADIVPYWRPSVFSLAEITSGGAAIAGASPPRAVSAGIRGSVRWNRSHSWRDFALNGCCRATANGRISRRRKCGVKYGA